MKTLAGFCAGAGAALFALSAALAQPVDVAPSTPVVELPVFEVTDSRLLPPPESWRYAEIPGFEILSNMSASATRRFVDDFHVLQSVVREIMPALMHGQVPVPTALILCGRGNSFDQFVPADQAAGRFGKNSLFFQNPERAAIVVDFALAELQIDNDTTEESDPYRGFYLEYFRFLIRRQMNPPPPVWFEEGLVQIFGAMDFNRKWVTFAQIGDGFGGEKTGDFNRRLSRRALIPMKDLLEGTGRQKRGAFWSAQCYGFVHLCLYGMNKQFQKPFVTYLQRLSTEPPTEQLFKDCFKKSYNQMALELRGYIEFTNYSAVQFTAKKGQELAKPPSIELRAAPDAVVGRLKGEVLRLAGHGVEARNALIAPYVRGERDPRLLAALGLDERLAGNDERARKFLEAAAKANVDRAHAWMELGRLRLAEAKAKPVGADGKLSAEQTANVLTALFNARQRPPHLAEVYALIAETWSASANAPQREHMQVVIEGVRMFPQNVSLLTQATLLAAARGFSAEARSLAEYGTRAAIPVADQDRFRLILAAVERDHPLPAREGAVPITTGTPAAISP